MKTLKIDIPEGYEIDEEKSTFQNIVFKPVYKVKEKWIDLGLPSGTLWAENNNEHFREYLGFKDAIHYYPDNLPTKEQFEELFALYHRWNNDKKGIEVLGNNGNILFFPAKGCIDATGINFVGESCHYWSSSEDERNLLPYWYMYMSKITLIMYGGSGNYNYSIRLVNNNKLI
jgi:hypothetical protein